MPPARTAPHHSAPLDFGSVRVRTPLAFQGERIGLLGGSFNPAHAGHLNLSQHALRRLGLTRVWWLVSPGNPLKSRDELADYEHRLALARQIATDRRIVVTGFETGLPSAYTVATLGFLHRRYPQTRFVWLMGADSLAGLDRWRHWHKLMATMPVAVIDRPGWRLRGLAAKAARRSARTFVTEDRARLLPGLPAPAWTFITVPLSPLSSTALRAQARTHQPGKPSNSAAKRP